MDQLITEYQSYQREVRRRSPRTIGNYLPVVREFIGVVAPNGDTDALRRVDKATVREFLRRPTPTGNPAAPPLWNMRLAAVRSLLSYLVETEVLTLNVALKLDRQKVHSHERIPLSFDELLRLVDAAAEHSDPTYLCRNVAILLTLIHTALRVAEVVSLDLRQVDFDHHFLHDVRAKGGKSLAVAINDVVAEAMQNYLADRERLHPAGDELALFVSDRGTRLSIRSVQELVKRFGKLANISVPVTPHVLRHSSATRLAELGTPLRVVQEICGHASVVTTERYVHVNGNERRRAIDALAATWKQRCGAREQPKLGPTTASCGAADSAYSTQRAQNCCHPRLD